MNAGIGRLYQDFVDGVATFQADLLRRTAAVMADELDRAAQRDIEGARDWRDFKTGKENRHAGARA